MVHSVFVTGNIAINQLDNVEGHGSDRLLSCVALDPVDDGRYLYTTNQRAAGVNHGSCFDNFANACLLPRRCIVSGASLTDLIHYLINFDEGIWCDFHKITYLMNCPCPVHGQARQNGLVVQFECALQCYFSILYRGAFVSRRQNSDDPGVRLLTKW